MIFGLISIMKKCDKRLDKCYDHWFNELCDKYKLNKFELSCASSKEAGAETLVVFN